MTKHKETPWICDDNTIFNSNNKPILTHVDSNEKNDYVIEVIKCVNNHEALQAKADEYDKLTQYMLDNDISFDFKQVQEKA